MVDTVNFIARWTLAADIVSALETREFYDIGNWYFEASRRPDRAKGGSFVKLTGWHQELGIVVRGRDGVIEWVQASLPRVLFGYNGRLITNPFQLEESQERLFEHLSEIAVAEERLIEFVRVDLVLNLPGDPRKFVAMHPRRPASVGPARGHSVR